MLSITLEMPLHCSTVRLDSPASCGATLVSVVSTGVGLADALSSAIALLGFHESAQKDILKELSNLKSTGTRWPANDDQRGAATKRKVSYFTSKRYQDTLAVR